MYKLFIFQSIFKTSLVIVEFETLDFEIKCIWSVQF
jgi:hypothetical protein